MTCRRGRTRAGGVLLALLLASGCAAHVTDAAGPDHRRDRLPDAGGQLSPDAASRLCQAAAGAAGTVLTAHLTTVDAVRRREAARPPVSPRRSSWASLPGDAHAAWCAVRTGSTYTVAAVTRSARVVAFIAASTPLDVGPDGPPVP